ncbi:MAG: MoaD/ThiS family protein [Cellulomonadaceae bacterium]|jgi:molybdopterin converting factor small subunit|nr:MoaD/ThiS family protein [Cellulomonadaceae bacterium]
MKIRLFAAARDAFGWAEATVVPQERDTLLTLLQAYADDALDPAEARRVLARCTLLANGSRVPDPATAAAHSLGDVLVDVLPPLSGG